MNELLESQSQASPAASIIIVAVAAVLVLAAAGYLDLPRRFARRFRRAGPREDAGRAATGFRVPGRGAHAVVQPGRRDLRSPATARPTASWWPHIGDTLTLKVPGGTVDMGLGKERYIDLQGDSKPDIRIVWNDVDRTSPQKRVNLGLYRTDGQQPAACRRRGGDSPLTPRRGRCPRRRRDAPHARAIPSSR